MNKQIRRAFAALVATTALTSGLLSAVSPAHAATASDVASLARANEGRHYCDTNSLGGSGFQGPQENSCTGFPWCADFAGWVWANAGDHSIDVNTLTQGSWTFYNYGKNHGTLHTDPNYRPQIGDAAVYNATVDANGYASHADHVGLVTKTNTDGSIEITNGNFGTDNTTSTVLTEVISAAQVPVGSYQSGEGKTVSAYVSPSGLAALPPSSSSSPLQVSGDFNGDGRADMAIMYRRGDGSIQPITALGDTAGHIGGFDLGGTTIPAGAWDWNSFQVYPGDFNGDGRTDLGVMYKQADGRISFMHAMADTTGRIGTFNNAVTIAAAAGWDYNAIRLTTGDFNGDKRTDVGLLYHHADGAIDVLTALSASYNGDLTNFTGNTIPASAGWDWNGIKLTSGDINGDGRADMAIMYRRGDGSIQPITALGDTAGHIGGFDLGGTTITAGAWDWNSFQLYPGDFNGDKRTDLGVMYKQTDGRISFMHAMADTTGRIGTFNNAVTIAAAAGWDYNAIRLTTGDFNGDKRTDVGLLYHHADGAIDVLTALSASYNGDLTGFTGNTIPAAAGWDWNGIKLA